MTSVSDKAREAAANFGLNQLSWSGAFAIAVADGLHDHEPIVQAFARFEAEIREECAQALEATIQRGYEHDGSHSEEGKCEHGTLYFEECIACYDEVLTRCATAIRQLKGSADE